jgi:single-stranded DNA-binding protein
MTPSRGRDMARLTLIGNLARDPETRLTKNDKEYIMYAAILLTSGYLSTLAFQLVTQLQRTVPVPRRMPMEV